jgi:hypothetical protein
MEKKRDIDRVGGLEIWTELFKMFGPKRAAELVGWAVVWQLTGVSDLKAMREDLESRGLSQATAYKAAADVRRFVRRLEDTAGCSFSPVEAIQALTLL